MELKVKALSLYSHLYTLCQPPPAGTGTDRPVPSSIIGFDSETPDFETIINCASNKVMIKMARKAILSAEYFFIP